MPSCLLEADDGRQLWPVDRVKHRCCGRIGISLLLRGRAASAHDATASRRRSPALGGCPFSQNVAHHEPEKPTSARTQVGQCQERPEREARQQDTSAELRGGISQTGTLSTTADAIVVASSLPFPPGTAHQWLLPGGRRRCLDIAALSGRPATRAVPPRWQMHW